MWAAPWSRAFSPDACSGSPRPRFGSEGAFWLPSPPKRGRGEQYGLFFPVKFFVDLVLRNLVGNAAPRQAADVGRAADVSACPFQRASQVALLKRSSYLGKLLAK